MKAVVWSSECLVVIVSLLLCQIIVLPLSEAQSPPELRAVPNQCVSEADCPVVLNSAKTELEVDPFGTPGACRIYIDYKNVGPKPLNAVKFRVGYIDAEEKVRGIFHAPDNKVVEPGAQVAAKWRGEKVSPSTRYVKIRVLLVRFADGSLWQSEKMKDVLRSDNALPQATSSGVEQSGAPNTVPGAVESPVNALPSQAY